MTHWIFHKGPGIHLMMTWRAPHAVHHHDHSQSMTHFTPNMRKLRDCSAPANVLMYILFFLSFFYFFMFWSFSATHMWDRHADRVPVVPSFWYQKTEGDTSLQTTFCGFFLLYNSFHLRCSVCVAVVTACLSCAESRTPRRINVKKAFYFLFFCVPTYCVGDARTGDRQRQREDLIYFCAASTLKWRLNSTDRPHSRPSADIYFASTVYQLG